MTINPLQALGLCDPATLEDFDVLTRMASLVTGAPNAFVSFADEHHLWSATAAGPRIGSSRETALCSALLESDEDTLVSTDVRNDPRTRDIAARRKDSIVSYAGALLKTDDGRRLGTLCVTDVVARPLSEEQVHLLKGLARQAMNLVTLRATKRELTEALDRMTELARTDGLTGLLNRRTFYEEAQSLHKLVLRQGGSLSLVQLDLDHFKRINDEFGHAAGDAVLRGVGALLQSQLRSTDRIGRVGGEEFAIAMPFTTVEHAAQRVERLRQRVAEKLIAHGAERIAVTVSGGVAELLSHETSIDAALRRADQALYRAKGEGRNRILRSEDIAPRFSVVRMAGLPHQLREAMLMSSVR